MNRQKLLASRDEDAEAVEDASTQRAPVHANAAAGGAIREHRQLA